MINDEQILEIRQKADIVDVISEYISVSPHGKNHVSVCPFHDDHNPSMVISKEKQIFNCFTCHSGGNIFTFVMKYENVTFPEAVKIVASKVGVNLNVKSIGNNEKFQKDYDIMDLSKKYYLNNINTKHGLEAKKYLNKRGITDDVINDFKIGLAVNEKDSLTNFLISQSYNVNELDKLGLTSKNGVDIYDTFRNRIVIPIDNISGNTVGFTGRIFNGEDTAKYMNTKETHIFKKSNILFNYYNAKNYIREEKKVIIVEGNMDAIKMHASGIKNVVAIMGTAMTNEHVEILRKLKYQIILMFDNDNAGYEATLKNGELLLSKGISAEVIRLSEAKDPDEYIEKFGIEALKENIDKPIKYLDFKIEAIKQNKDLNSAEELSKFVKEIIELLKYVDNITKNIIVDKICKEYGIDKKVLINEVKPAEEVKYEVKEEVVKKKDNYKLIADIILYYIASDAKYLKIYKDDLNFFKEKEERNLASEINHFYEENKNGTFADFITYISKEEVLHKRILEIMSEYTNEELEHHKFIEYLEIMKGKIKKDEIKELKEKIKNELDINKKIKLMEKLTQLKK